VPAARHVDGRVAEELPHDDGYEQSAENAEKADDVLNSSGFHIHPLCTRPYG